MSASARVLGGFWMHSQNRLKRAVISGGDTSGPRSINLSIDALTASGALAPGSSVPRPPRALDRDGLEIALKGGQVGARDFFVAAKCGGPDITTIGERQ
jgi:uncharacterized protein YgbK (DUF1537 family)